MRTLTEQEFENLFDKYSQAIFRHCFFRVSDREVARDITQDVFVRFWNYTEKVQVQNNRALLYKMASNLIIDHYRTRKDTVSLDSLPGFVSHSAVYDGEEEMQIRHGVKQVHRLLLNLNEQDKEIFILRFIDELTLSEISDVLGESKNTVAVRLHRVVKKVRKLAKEEI